MLPQNILRQTEAKFQQHRGSTLTVSNDAEAIDSKAVAQLHAVLWKVGRVLYDSDDKRQQNSSEVMDKVS